MTRRKVDRESNLSPDTRTRGVFAAQEPKRETEILANGIRASQHGLQLASGQPRVAGVAAIYLDSQREPGCEVAQNRDSSRVYSTTPGLNADYACARVSRK